MRKEHPLIVALVESYADEIGVPRAELWAALDRKPSREFLIRGLVAAFEPRVRESDFVLASRRKSGTLGTMSTSPATTMAAPRRGRPITMDHPLMAALKEAGVSVVDEAKAVRRSPASVRSFCAEKDSENYRPVPRAIAERWGKVYGVPLSTWPRIAD